LFKGPAGLFFSSNIGLSHEEDLPLMMLLHPSFQVVLPVDHLVGYKNPIRPWPHQLPHSHLLITWQVVGISLKTEYSTLGLSSFSSFSPNNSLSQNEKPIFILRRSKKELNVLQ
jgi:hypothetical protein